MKNLFQDLIKRGLVLQSSQESLPAGIAVKSYVGIDPTGPSLHVGHLVPLFTLLRLQRGCRQPNQPNHSPIVVLGSATACIGDPSGKRSERPLLAESTVNQHCQRLRRQLVQLFERAGSSVDVLENGDWTKPLTVVQFLRSVGKHVPVRAMLGRDSVQSRLTTGISFAEFSYSLLQAHDFAHLHRTAGVSVQIGGSDQWGNIVAGLDLIRRWNADSSSGETTNTSSADPMGFTVPLLTTGGKLGQKLGKTADAERGQPPSTVCWLDPNRTSPLDFYQHFINLADTDAECWHRWLSLEPLAVHRDLVDQQTAHPARRSLQKALATELTDLVHGQATAAAVETVVHLLHRQSAQQLAQFWASAKHASPAAGPIVQALVSTVRTVTVSKQPMPPATVDLESWSVAQLLETTGLAPSRGQAKRLLKTGNTPVTVSGRTLHPAVANEKRIFDSVDLVTEYIQLKQAWDDAANEKQHQHDHGNGDSTDDVHADIGGSDSADNCVSEAASSSSTSPAAKAVSPWQQFAASIEVLDHEEDRVKDLVSKKLKLAFEQGDDELAHRLASCFAPLQLEEEGLIEFYNHVQRRFVHDAQAIFESILDDSVVEPIPSAVTSDVPSPPQQPRPTVKRSCAQALTALFERVAWTLDDYTGNLVDVDAVFGPGSATFFVESLQIQSDLWASRIFRHFLERLQLQDLVIRLKQFPAQAIAPSTSQSATTASVARRSHQSASASSSSASTANNAAGGKVDPRDLTDLLEEMAAMSQCTEFYYRFLRDKLIDSSGQTAAETVSDGANLVEDKNGGSATATAAAAAVKPRQVRRESPVNQHLQEIRSYYEIFEEHFLTESLRKAMEMDERETDDSLTSMVVEYVFFVVHQSTRRALLASSVKSACAILYLLSNAIQFEYAGVLRDGWRLHSQAGDVRLALVALNNVSASAECVRTVQAQLQRDGATALAAADAQERDRWATSLTELQGTAEALDRLADELLGELLRANGRLLESLFEPVTRLSYADLDFDQFAAYEVNEPFAHDLAAGIDDLLHPVHQFLLPRAFDALMGVAASAVAMRLEQAVHDKQFNELGGVLLNAQVNFLLEHFDSQCSEPTQRISKAFLRLQQIASVFMCETLTEMVSYWADGLLRALTAAEVAQLARAKAGEHQLTGPELRTLERRLAQDDKIFKEILADRDRQEAAATAAALAAAVANVDRSQHTDPDAAAAAAAASTVAPTASSPRSATSSDLDNESAAAISSENSESTLSKSTYGEAVANSFRLFGSIITGADQLPTKEVEPKDV